MKKSILKKYAKLIAESGLNVQKGQDVIINAGLDQPEFVAMVVEACYKRKANSVTVNWNYDPLKKLDYKYRSIASLSDIPTYKIEQQKHYVKTNPAMLYLLSEDPDGLKGIDQEKMAKVSMKTYPIMKPFKDARENKYQWCIAGVPGQAWARKVFPKLSKKKAMDKLWEVILYTSRALGDDPIKDWEIHNETLAEKMNKLNSLNLDYLQYHSANGTDFKVWMIPNAKWLTAKGEVLGNKGVFYNPNIPSEECFTSPMKGKAEGIVYASKPLSYQGQLIENFSIRFKDGKVCEVKASKNEDLLRQMVNMDEGASYLGEVALVPFDSPINNTGILFYNTLYDENAACHLALGMGFNDTIIDYEKYSKDEINNFGVNDSMIHVDFMIGTKDLDIIGHTRDGKTVQIFKNGDWAI